MQRMLWIIIKMLGERYSVFLQLCVVVFMLCNEINTAGPGIKIPNGFGIKDQNFSPLILYRILILY